MLCDDPDALVGAQKYLSESYTVGQDATIEDQAEEIESLLSGLKVDDQLSKAVLFRPEEQQPDNGTLAGKHQWTAVGNAGNIDQLSANLKKVSNGVIVEMTLSDYACYWNQFKGFVTRIGKVKCPGDINTLFPNVLADFPTWISLWIMEKCNENDIWTGKPKPPMVLHATYGTAQKMHIAISHKFGHDYGLGTQPWMEHPT